MFGIFRKPIKPSKAKSTKKNNNTKSVTFFSKFLYGSLVILVWGTILLVPLVVYYAYDLPDISNLEQNNTKSTIMVMAQNGDVISAVLDQERSRGTNSNMVEKAIKYAKMSRFEFSNEKSQTGWISYKFISQ